MTEQLKILFLSANPKNITHIRLDEEVREVDEKIRMGEFRDQLSLIPHLAVRPDDLHQTLLRHRPHILHFSGHGSPTEGIVLEDNNGLTRFVSTEALAALFRAIKDNLRIVVLNACYSSVQAKAISQTVDFTIGMQKAIGDHSAIVFSAALYRGLAYGRSVQESFDLGVNALMLAGIPEAHTPVLLKKRGAKAAETYLLMPPSDKHRGGKEETAKPTSPNQNVSVQVEGSTVKGRDVTIAGIVGK